MNPLGQGILNVFGKFFGLINLFRPRDFLHQILQVVHAILRRSVLPRRHFHRFRRPLQVQVVRLNAARRVVPARIRMNGNKQVGLGLVGNIRPLFQRNKRIVRTRVHHVRARQALLDDFPQPQRHIQAQVFLHQASWANRSGIVAAVACIDHDPSNLQSQRAGQC